jgi:hypothetical protein
MPFTKEQVVELAKALSGSWPEDWEEEQWYQSAFEDIMDGFRSNISADMERGLTFFLDKAGLIEEV